MLNIKIALCLSVLANYSYSSSLQSQLKSHKFDPFIKNLNRVYNSTCGYDCQRCSDKLKVHIEEIEATCGTYRYDGSLRDFCFGLYMNVKCYKEFARKFCERCDEFNAFEIYANDYIISIENEVCSYYPSQPCDSNFITSSASSTITGPTPWTTPSYPDPSTTTTVGPTNWTTPSYPDLNTTTTAGPTNWTTPSYPDLNTTTTQPETTTAKDSCDSQCNCNCNCNFNIVPQ